MCGIAGTLSLDPARPADARLVQRMTDTIAHRGPDGEGQYVRGPVGLGHRRLSIIDLDTGAQPMCNEDATVWIVFNGEIYNYRELREDLLRRGHVFRSTSDTEVIVHLYEEYGEACLERLQGMFAFALWDERQRSLLLARDRVGIKPLYYVQTGSALLFASEIKALLVDPEVRPRFNPEGIDRFLTYYYLPGNDTLFEGIHKLEPGHYLTVRGGVVRKTRYWDLSFEAEPQRMRFAEAVEALQQRLKHTVEQHMISDVPVGVLLSGGVDSTGVLRYAAQHSAQPIRTFTVGFAGEGFADERPFAQLAANHYGTVHQEITVTADDFGDNLARYVWHMEEPVCEPPAIALYLVSKLARESSVKVLLSGEGGDEAFGGYNKYRNLLALERMKSAFSSARGLLRWGLGSLRHAGLAPLRKAANFAPFVDLPLSHYYFSCTSTPLTPFNLGKAGLYNPAFSDRLGSRSSEQPTRDLFNRLKDLPALHQMLHVDTKTWLPDDLLVKADKMTMATSVELRVPLLDAKLLEFAASLSPGFKVSGFTTKRILKAALKESVPAAILKRKKSGFPVPYDRWLRNELKERVFDQLLSRRSVLFNYFERDAVVDILERHQRGQGGSQEVFSLLVLEMLHQQFVATPHALAA